MKRTFRLTTREFIDAMQRAHADDQRWPWLCSVRWLWSHARSKDDEVVIVTNGDHAPRPPTSTTRG